METNYLVLVRHGQSTWNLENKFTGWTDVDLTSQGEEEAKEAGKLLMKENFTFDIVHTSLLKRANRTMQICLNEMGQLEIPIYYSWRLNERHYGSLTGLNKEETKKKIGEEQFKKYRRSWDISPPAMEEKSEYQNLFSPLNASIPVGTVPFTESLKDTYDRVVPFYEKEIKENLQKNKNILISAHGNSLRSLCKYLFKLDNKKISKLEIPTGNPLFIEFDGDNKILNCEYLDSERAKDLLVY